MASFILTCYAHFVASIQRPQSGRILQPIRGAAFSAQSFEWWPRCTATKARLAIPVRSYHAGW